MTRTAAAPELSAPNVLDDLRSALQRSGPLQPLDPAEYAVGHALFEARSDQRAHLVEWLIDELATRSNGPTRVLSIGCGDGSVDARIAAALTAGGQGVEYVGVEPHGPSAQGFLTRLRAVAGVDVSVLQSAFADAHPAGTFDVVLAVHSLYYVDDLAAALRHASAVLAPGGELVVLHAPCGPLNELVRILAPGHPQEFSEQVASTLAGLGATQVTPIDSRLDLSPTGNADTDRRLLEFTVQARLPRALHPAVRAALVAQALPGPGTVVAHPVDALVLRQPAQTDARARGPRRTGSVS